MNKKKKIIIIIIVVLVVIGTTVGILSAVKNRNKEKKSVKVFSVSEIASPSNWYENGSYMWGYVETSMIQNVYISANQKVEEVKVTEGQNVKAGDVLIVYDTTAQELALDLKRADVEIARTAVIVAERELEELKQIVPIEDKPVEPTTEEPATTEEEPQEPETPVEPETPAEPENPEEPESPDNPENPADSETPVDPETPANPEPPAEPETPAQPEIPEEQEEPENVYTRDELKKAIADKEAEIKSLKIDYQLSQIDLQIMEYQNSNGEVVALFDGQVTSVLGEDDALLNSKPMIVVSGDSGCTVTANIGELSLETITLGDIVELYSYESGNVYSGTITEIVNTPSEGYSYDNSESYYPIKITVKDATDLKPGMGVDVTIPVKEEGSDAFYLPMAFVKEENGKYYVMRDNNGVLEKKYVSVGKILWGDQIKIYSGVTMEDMIAFPYSKDAVEGTATTPGSMQDLYGY